MSTDLLLFRMRYECDNMNAINAMSDAHSVAGRTLCRCHAQSRHIYNANITMHSAETAACPSILGLTDWPPQQHFSPDMFQFHGPRMPVVV